MSSLYEKCQVCAHGTSVCCGKDSPPSLGNEYLHMYHAPCMYNCSSKRAKHIPLCIIDHDTYYTIIIVNEYRQLFISTMLYHNYCKSDNSVASRPVAHVCVPISHMI